MTGVVPGLGYITPPVIVSTGSTTTNPMAANLVLTLKSTFIQSVYPNAAGLAIQLPDATTMPITGLVFILENKLIANGNPVQIIDSASTLIGWLIPGATAFVKLNSLAAATGNWSLSYGDMARDGGIHWFGASTHQSDGNANSYIDSDNGKGALSSYMCSATLGVMYLPANAIHYFVGFSIVNGKVKLGAGLAPSSAFSSGNDTSSCCYNGATEVAMMYGTSAGTYQVEVVDINSGTLATTLPGSLQTTSETSSTAGSTCSMDSIDGTSGLCIGTTNNVLNTRIKLTVFSGTGASFAVGSQATLTSSSVAYGGCESALLTSTLTHTLYHTGTTVSVTRTTISGTTPTAGNSVTVASRKAYVGQSQLVRLSATTSLAVYTDSGDFGRGTGVGKGTAVYGAVITDASTPTINETLLIPASLVASTTAPAQFPMLLVSATKTANGKIKLLLSDGVHYKEAVVSAVSGAAVLGPITPVIVDGIPLSLGSAVVNTGSYRGVSNVVAFPILTNGPIPLNGTGANTFRASLTLQPQCLA